MTCSVCKSSVRPLSLALIDMLLVKCDACDIVYNAARDSHLSEPVESFSESFFENYGNHSLMFDTDCERIQAYLGLGSLTGVKILDLGCGMGWFLKHVETLGAQVVGIEANSKLCQRVNESGIKCYSSIEAAVKDNCKVDVVYCSHTLEHFLDPFEALINIKYLLKENGAVSFTIPCLNFATLQLERILKRLNLQGGWGLFYSVHMTFFNRKSLIRTLQKANYQQLAVMPGVFGENFIHGIVANKKAVTILYRYCLTPLLYFFALFSVTPNLSILGRIRSAKQRPKMEDPILSRH